MFDKILPQSEFGRFYVTLWGAVVGVCTVGALINVGIAAAMKD